MLPTVVFFNYDWLAQGMAFLWGALFVSLTDTPGPIRHRRNSLVIAILLNTLVAAITLALSPYPWALIVEIIVFTFLFSLIGVYGTRASAVGTLALVMMLIHMAPDYAKEFTWRDPALVAAGGLWYAALGLLLYRLWPYRLAEQAVGENLIDTADYLRARASFYKPDADVPASFNSVMAVQVTLLKKQEQLRELLLKTRQFVADATPRSRSLMMVFADSIDMFEHTISTYQDYSLLQQKMGSSNVVRKVYSMILQLAAETELIGLAIQSGRTVKTTLDVKQLIGETQNEISQHLRQQPDAATIHVLQGLQKTLVTIQNMTDRLTRIVLYARMEKDTEKEYAAQLSSLPPVITQPIHWRTLVENLSLESNDFRHALRITIAVVAGYGISALLSITHTYWILLTIVTILRPVYALSRKRNGERLLGTLIGAALATGLLFVVKGDAALLAIMILAMVMSYSFLRLNYFGFVLFLTLYIVITFHFLHPVDTNLLVRERLIDTLIGSAIAALASRFILPVWTHGQLEKLMRDMLCANAIYFEEVWKQLTAEVHQKRSYVQARKKAIIALTNLSDGFQRMLAEPRRVKEATLMHQFVITAHMLTGHITALSTDKQAQAVANEDTCTIKAALILEDLRTAKKQLTGVVETSRKPVEQQVIPNLRPLMLISSLAHELKVITTKMQQHEPLDGVEAGVTRQVDLPLKTERRL